MPRYYFDIQDAKGSHRDDVGDELRDFEAAREMAQSIMPDIVRQDLPDGESHVVICDVRDETGVVVYRGKLIYQGTRF